MPKTIYVYENWSGGTPTKLGRLYVDQARGSEQYAFEYDETWMITSRFAYVLDPDLSLYKGRQYPIDKNTFGIFADSAPDREGVCSCSAEKSLLPTKKSGSRKNFWTVTTCWAFMMKLAWGRFAFVWKTAARSCRQTEKWLH